MWSIADTNCKIVSRSILPRNWQKKKEEKKRRQKCRASLNDSLNPGVLNLRNLLHSQPVSTIFNARRSQNTFYDSRANFHEYQLISSKIELNRLATGSIEAALTLAKNADIKLSRWRIEMFPRDVDAFIRTETTNR